MKTLRAWLAIGGLFILLPDAFAQFTYSTNGSVITLTSYTGSSCAVTISNFVTSIGQGAFANNGLANVTIPTSVTCIGDNAFGRCSNLTCVSIPDSVASIGYAAFESCWGLISVTIGNGVTNIGAEAFLGEPLGAITVDVGNSFYSSTNGVLFDKNQTTLIQFSGSLDGGYTIPSSVTNIDDYAFYSYGNLTSVIIPDSVTGIGYSAFFEDWNVTNVTIGNSVTSIGDWAFTGTSLDSVIIPNTVTNMGDYTFDQCAGLTNVTIGNSVTSIEEDAFSATGLTSVIIPNSVTSIGDFAFALAYSLNNVYFQGNAPTVGYAVFDEDNNATAYYLPGTTGWTNFSANTGLPVVLWNPTIQTTNGNFGIQANQFGFTITGTANIPIAVQAGTNLSCAAWTTVQSCTLTNGSIYFADPAWANYPNRFYRIFFP